MTRSDCDHTVATGKLNLSPLEVFCRGILCNALVCPSGLANDERPLRRRQDSGDRVPDHRVRDAGAGTLDCQLVFLPFAEYCKRGGLLSAAMTMNLVMSTLGNLIGGSLLVAAVYWVAYLRTEAQTMIRPL